ncbi:alpha/beta fold hydrolase [Vibrio sp. HN007]|uniref:alpha/beta fold hydrolase n=1 Tax=Vibrio iocasae TaxID=3098914 RepID=UPI0035D4E246
MMTKDSEYLLTTEKNFTTDIEGNIRALWEARNEGYLKNKTNKNLYWISLTSPNHSKAVVIVNGRIEGVWKYQELFYDFYRNGYDVYSFDHQGQGCSDRLVTNSDIGHVEFFSDYVEDMAAVIEQFQLHRYEKRFLVAHSMGGAISTRYLQLHSEHNFNAVALSAPMYGVNVAWYLKPISAPFMRLKAMFHSKPDYGTSNTTYYSKPFEDNPLSGCEVRYRWFRKLYEDKPGLKVGGPSARWIWQNLNAAKLCISESQKLTLPFLLLQASGEVIVSNKDQNKFIDKLRKTNEQARLEVVQGSRHEIFFENDEYRNTALTKLFSFFNKN